MVYYRTNPLVHNHIIESSKANAARQKQIIIGKEHASITDMLKGGAKHKRYSSKSIASRRKSNSKRSKRSKKSKRSKRRKRINIRNRNKRSKNKKNKKVKK